MEENALKSNKLVTPPGVLIKKIVKESRGMIEFPEKKSKSLLSPLVEASYKDHKLLITAVIFVAPSKNESLDLSIYQNCYTNIEGVPQLQFFVCYDMLESKSKDFFVYEVTFEAEKIPFDGGLSQIKTIQTFLWDVDPVASRGTVTNVQPAA
jgi:hypothetical protein